MKSNFVSPSFIFCLIFVILMTSSVTLSQKCLESKKPASVELKSLPEKFKVNIEFVDRLQNFSANILEYYNRDKNFTSLNCRRDKERFLCLYNRTTEDITVVNVTNPSDTTCKSSQMSEKMRNDSFLFPYVLTKKSVMGLFDLYELFRKSENVSEDLSVDSEMHDHGMPVKHYVGCQKIADGKYWMEFSVCITDDGKNFRDYFDKPVPTQIEVNIYEAKPNATYNFSAVYELSAYEDQFEANEEERYLLTPCGVYCDGMNNTKPLPELPKNFSLFVEYINPDKKRIDQNEIFYDDANKITSFVYSHTNLDEAISKGLLNAPIGHYKVVHDFHTGVQYVLDALSGACVNTSAIPSEVGDVVVDTPTRIMRMMDAFQLLFKLNETNYVYVGERFENVPVDVWIAKMVKKDVTTIYELGFSTGTWLLEDGYMKSVRSLPVYLKTYRKDTVGTTETSVQHFHGLTVYGDKAGLFWPELDVFTCMNTTSSSFYMIQLNETMESLKKIGLHVIESELRGVLAGIAKITVLRIGNIKILDDKNGANISFGVAEKFGNAGALTDVRINDTEAVKAIDNLNKSIATADFTFNVTSLTDQKLFLAIRKGSFSTSRYYPPADPTSGGKTVIVRNKGYTGGSMAAMGIFMLLIGGVAGVVLAFVYLRRNRGGIAYQIYE